MNDQQQTESEEEKEIPRGIQEAESYLPLARLRTESQIDLCGFFDSGYKTRIPTTHKEMKTVQVGDKDDNLYLHIVPSSFGYPNTHDLDYYRGLQKLMAESMVCHMMRNPQNERYERMCHIENPLHFSIRKLVIYAGRAKDNASVSKRERESAKDFLIRLKLTGIYGHLIIQDRKGKRYLTESGGQQRIVSVIDDLFMHGDELPSGERADEVVVYFSRWYRCNFAYGYVKHVDMELHGKLDLAVAKNLYPIIARAYYKSGGHFHKNYDAICNIFSIKRYTHWSSANRQLKPAMDELEKQEFNAPGWELRKVSKTDFVLECYAGQRWIETEEVRLAKRTVYKQIESEKEVGDNQNQGELFGAGGKAQREKKQNELFQEIATILSSAGSDMLSKQDFIDTCTEVGERKVAFLIKQIESQITEGVAPPEGLSWARYYWRMIDELKEKRAETPSEPRTEATATEPTPRSPEPPTGG